ncbi:MAG: AraC family transcriptional regulator [Gorillibacterium sp.]|nr:AraC family transcriptional regulator [Gorillibacterium sp.]
MVRKRIEVTPSSLFFDGECPYYANRISESYDLQLHRHEFTEICYIGEGVGTQYIGEETIPVSRGDLFVLPVGTSHVFRPSSPDSAIPLVVYNFIFMPGRVAEALRDFPGLDHLENTLKLLNLVPGNPEWRSFKDSSDVFHPLMLSAFEEIRLRRFAYIPRLHCLFIMLMIEMERHLSSIPESYSGERDRLMQAALSFIRNTFTSPITVSQVASVAQLSQRHFHRQFLKLTGMTFTRYIQDLRLERSKELLRSTRLTIPDIAEAVGYQDKGFFLELFKKRMGQTPRDYRKG